MLKLKLEIESLFSFSFSGAIKMELKEGPIIILIMSALKDIKLQTLAINLPNLVLMVTQNTKLGPSKVQIF